MVEFTAQHPEIFLWLNLHTFGGVFIRPLGDKPDTKMNQRDLALFRQLGAWAEEITGYPMVSGSEEFTYEPDTPLHGDLTDYAYHQRGAVAYVVELWDLFKQAGLERKKRFVDNYTHLTRADMLKIAAWDRDKNDGRSLLPWRTFMHPQLGKVEVGGIDPRIGMWNPPPSEMPGVCTTQSAHFLRTAALAPAVVVDAVETHALESAQSSPLTRVTVTVANHGYLPTFILDSAKALTHNEPLWADVSCDGCELAEPSLGPSRDRPSRRLGARTVRRFGRALLHADARHDGRAHGLVGRARPRRDDRSCRLVPRRLDHARIEIG